MARLKIKHKGQVVILETQAEDIASIQNIITDVIKNIEYNEEIHIKN